MAKTTAFFEAYRTAQNSLVGLKIAVLDVINGHRGGVSTEAIGRLLGTAPRCLGEAHNDVVAATLRIMEMEGTVFLSENLWKVTDVT
jgi:hypothetical protein